MKVNTVNKINDFLSKNPIAKGTSSNDEQISFAENTLNIVFNSDYKFFIQTFGGCMIGACEIYAFENSELMDETNIIDLTESYRIHENGVSDRLIIGTDYSGNSIGIDFNGKIVVDDYDLDEMFILAESFEEYLLKALEEN